MKRVILVECTYQIPVEIEDDEEYFKNIDFHLEENHCPGTGDVGLAFDKHYQRSKKNQTCWACVLYGENKIIDYDYKKEAKC